MFLHHFFDCSIKLKTKLKSRQAVWEAVNLQNVSFDYTDKPTLEGGVADRCAEINQASIDWATSKVYRYPLLSVPLALKAFFHHLRF